MLWEEERKCYASVVGLDLVLALSKVRRCSLKRSFKRRLKDRFNEQRRTLDNNSVNVSVNEHRRTLDNANTKCKPTTVAEHFLSSPHNVSKDMQLIPIHFPSLTELIDLFSLLAVFLLCSQ